MKILVIHFKRQSPAWFVFGIALKLLSRLFDSLFTNSFKQLPLLLPQLFTSGAFPCPCHRLGESPRGNKSQHTINVAQSLRCWASVLSVGGTGGPASGAWGHHMQHQHIARLAAQPGQPPAWLRSYVPGLLVDKEIEKEVDKARPQMNWWTTTWLRQSFFDPSSPATQATAPLPCLLFPTYPRASFMQMDLWK